MKVLIQSPSLFSQPEDPDENGSSGPVANGSSGHDANGSSGPDANGSGIINSLRDESFREKIAPSHQQMSMIQFCNMVRNHGADKILFGTDSPWASQKESLKLLTSSGLSHGELADIMGGNAARLLGI